MKPNFSESTTKRQAVMGTSCSKRNSDYAPRKKQFFATSMVSPGTGVQKSPPWAYSTGHGHERPELSLTLALLWSKDFQGSLPTAEFIAVFCMTSGSTKGVVLLL